MEIHIRTLFLKKRARFKKRGIFHQKKKDAIKNTFFKSKSNILYNSINNKLPFRSLRNKRLLVRTTSSVSFF